MMYEYILWATMMSQWCLCSFRSRTIAGTNIVVIHVESVHEGLSSSASNVDWLVHQLTAVGEA